jgi:hypothetical protein
MWGMTSLLQLGALCEARTAVTRGAVPDQGLLPDPWPDGVIGVPIRPDFTLGEPLALTTARLV